MNPSVILQKIKDVYSLAYELTDDLVPDGMTWYKLYRSFRSTIDLMKGIDRKHPEWRERYFSQDNTNTSIYNETSIKSAEVETLVEYLDYSDLAYNLNTAQVKAALRPKGYKLIRHDTTTQTGRAGHFLAVQYQTKEVLLGIRGTSTFYDILTDIIGKPIAHSDYKKGLKCHEGIFMAAKMMFEDTRHLLENCFQDYKVTICGHSLGAGVSTILGILLKEHLPEIDLQVYAFATPPCCSRDASLACQSYITSVVNNNDCVPRMSLSNLRTMHKLFSLVDRRTEHKVARRKHIDSDQPLLSADELEDFLQTEFKKDDNDEKVGEIELYVPGKVVSIWNNTQNPATVGSRITTGLGQAFRQLFVEPSMLSDHASNRYRQNLLNLWNQTSRTF